MKKIILSTCLLTVLVLAGIDSNAQTAADAYGTNPYAVAEPMLYPNPVGNEARIVLPYITTHRLYLYVIDFTGRVIQNAVYAPGGNELIVDLTTLENGFYNIRLIEDGMFPLNIKFVKE